MKFDTTPEVATRWHLKAEATYYGQVVITHTVMTSDGEGMIAGHFRLTAAEADDWLTLQRRLGPEVAVVDARPGR